MNPPPYDYKPTGNSFSDVKSIADSGVGFDYSSPTYLTNSPKTLQLESHTFSRDRQISLDGKLLFTARHKTVSLSHSTTILDADEQTLCQYSSRHHCFSQNTWYARDGNGQAVWELNRKHTGASGKVSTVTFPDAIDGSGSGKMRYVQRSRMQMGGELVHPEHGVIARVYSESSWSGRRYSIDVQPGADLLLVASVVAAVQDKVRAEQMLTNSAVINSSVASSTAAAAATA